MTENETTTNSVDEFYEKLFSNLIELRNQLAPEKQYLISIFGTYFYLMVLIYPSKVPEKFQPMIELAYQLPTFENFLWFTIIGMFMGSIDAAIRIALERLPFYKAFLQVYLLNQSFEEDDE